MLNKTAALEINVGDETSGIDLTNAAPGALTIDGAATITVRFLEPPSHGSLHYGLRLAGDRMTELTTMGGNLVIDSSGLSRPAAFFLHQGDTYVGIPPPPGSLFLLR